MDITEWIHQLSLAYKKRGIEISQEKMAFLLSEFPEAMTDAQKQIVSEVEDIMTRLFLDKASRGETFGQLSRIKERFGDTLEENYGMSSGPFINMAKTYWIYKIEVRDLYPDYHNRVLSRILQEIESTIASVFFPTPGPYKIPVDKRREAQRRILQEYVPDIDIERFLSESPILKAEKSRRSCFGLILLFLFIPFAFLIVVSLLLKY